MHANHLRRFVAPPLSALPLPAAAAAGAAPALNVPLTTPSHILSLSALALARSALRRATSASRAVTWAPSVLEVLEEVGVGADNAAGTRDGAVEREEIEGPGKGFAEGGKREKI